MVQASPVVATMDHHIGCTDLTRVETSSIKQLHRKGEDVNL